MIVRPRPREAFPCPGYVEGWGRAWGADEIVRVEIRLDDEDTWIEASVARRKQFEWQLFSFKLEIPQAGRYCIQARATDRQGVRQALEGSRNYVPTVQIYVESGQSIEDTGGDVG